MSDEDDEGTRYDQMAPLDNTLSDTLSLFPLHALAPRQPARKRKHHGLYSAADVQSALSPSEEESLSDSMARTSVSPAGPPAKRPKIGNPQLLAQLVQRTQQACARMPAKIRWRGGGHILRGKKRAPIAAAALPSPPPTKEYLYTPPNEFGVRLVEPYRLFPYQAKTVQWLIERESGVNRHPAYVEGRNGCLLAMVMGLGKTMCAATLVAHTLNAQRSAGSATLYVCPKNLLGTVRFEFEKFFGDQLRILVYHASMMRSEFNRCDFTRLRQYDVVITNYSTARSRAARLAKFDDEKAASLAAMAECQQSPQRPSSVTGAALAFTNFPWFRIILDESHEIRERGNKIFRAMNRLKSPRRICMTGTPIHNRVADIFHQLEFTGLQLPSKQRKNRSLLDHMGLVGHVVRFVEHKDAKAVELPPKTVHKVYFRLSQQETALHEHFRQTACAMFRQANTSQGRQRAQQNMRVRAGLIRVMQICSAPHMVIAARLAKAEAGAKADRDEGEGADEAAPALAAADLPASPELLSWLRDRAGEAGARSSKMRAVVAKFAELRRQRPGGTMKTVMFANYSTTLRVLLDALEQWSPGFGQRVAFVHGGIGSAFQRETQFTRFRTLPEVELLLMTTKLGSVGLNLTEADTVFMIEPWFAYAPMHQAEGRVHRIGQLKPVNVFYFLAADSIEERVYRIAMEKKDMGESVASACEAHDRQLANGEVANILNFDLRADATDA